MKEKEAIRACLRALAAGFFDALEACGVAPRLPVALRVEHGGLTAREMTEETIEESELDVDLPRFLGHLAKIVGSSRLALRGMRSPAAKLSPHRDRVREMKENYAGNLREEALHLRGSGDKRSIRQAEELEAWAAKIERLVDPEEVST